MHGEDDPLTELCPNRVEQTTYVRCLNTICPSVRFFDFRLKNTRGAMRTFQKEKFISLFPTSLTSFIGPLAKLSLILLSLHFFACSFCSCSVMYNVLRVSSLRLTCNGRSGQANNPWFCWNMSSYSSKVLIHSVVRWDNVLSNLD